MNDIKNKIFGGLYGFTVGDALGVPVEFKTRDELEKNPIKEMIGNGTYNMPKGTWSDDTSMSLATYDSLNELNVIDYDDIMKKFCDWYINSKYTATGEFFDIGNTTRKSIINYMNGMDAKDCGGCEGKDNGNGSLMRILPIVMFLYNKNVTNPELTEFINDSSSMTHGNEISKLGCKIYCDYVMSLLSNYSKKDALENLRFNNYLEFYSKESIKYYEKILSGDINDEKKMNIDSTGFIVSTLEASIWCLLTTSCYSDAVLKAVNLGNDTDTVAAITGSLAGIAYGYDNIPKKWIDDLKGKEILTNIFESFYDQNYSMKRRI